MPLQAVTFDFHNTLAECDDWFQLEIRDLVPAILDRLAAHNGGVTDAERQDAVRLYRALREEIIHHGEELDAYACARHVLNQMGHACEPSVLKVTVDSVMRGALADCRPVSGVVETVHELRNRGVSLAVVSSAVHHDFLAWSLDAFGIHDAFDVVVTSASCGYYKTRTEIYEHALAGLGVSTDAAVHVGDSYRYDVQTAKRAGMRTIWYARDGHDNAGTDADLTVTSMVNLVDAIVRRFGLGD